MGAYGFDVFKFCSGHPQQMMVDIDIDFPDDMKAAFDQKIVDVADASGG